MAISCDTSDAPTFVRFTLEDDCASAAELISLRRALIRSGQLTATSCVLLDLRRAHTFPDVQELLTAFEEDAVWPVCRAFLVSTDVQHDVARRLQSLLGGQSTINEIFQMEATAMEWLAAMAARSPRVRV